MELVESAAFSLVQIALDNKEILRYTASAFGGLGVIDNIYTAYTLKDVAPKWGWANTKQISYSVLFICYLTYHTLSLPGNGMVLVLSFLGLDTANVSEFKKTFYTVSLVLAIVSGLGWAGLSAAPFAFMVSADSTL